MFLSADEGFVLRLADKGLTADQGTLYAIGRIVLFAPHGSSLQTEERARWTENGAGRGCDRTFAIANPEHAPYGRAPRRRCGMQACGSRQASAGSGRERGAGRPVRQLGSAQGGIIPYSLAVAPEVARLGRFSLIPEDWHKPLKPAHGAADECWRDGARVLRLRADAAGAGDFVRYGFVLPGETS